MSDLLLIFPEVSDDLVSNMMVAITKKIDESGSEIAVQGFLGGEHGYGAHYKNDVFEMRPFYWGDCECDYDTLRDAWVEENPHADDCYQTLFHERHYVDYDNWNFDPKPGHERDENFDDKCTCIKDLCEMFHIDPNKPGSYAHCTCWFDIKYPAYLSTISHAEECLIDKPNFKHYNSGIEVNWYKYIGRDMEINKDLSIEEWVALFKETIESIKKD